MPPPACLSLLAPLLMVVAMPPGKDWNPEPAEGHYGLLEVRDPSSDVLVQTAELPPASSLKIFPMDSKRGSHQNKRHWPQPSSNGPAIILASEPQDEGSPFLLGLQGLPGLAGADLSAQNPNIQVTIEVVENPQMEFEMDLLKEPRIDWSLSSSEWLAHKDLFWPLFWEYTDPTELESLNSKKKTQDLEEEEEDSAEYDGEGNTLSAEGGNWNQRWQKQKNWISTETNNYDYEDEGDWSPWASCSLTCGMGSQKRTRSCGYACTATEVRTCEQPRCPGGTEGDAEESPFQAENSTAEFTPDVDSCEKWLNCKSDFLTKYLSKVLVDLPSCPCSYPLEAVYNTVNIMEPTRGCSFRWKDASSPRERLDIYKPTAQFCLRSTLSPESTTLGAQHCCYQEDLKLITRGKGAGTPNLISTDFSPELHYKVDMLPWILCKGDWSRYHAIRPPNNGLGCTESPPQDEYISQLQEARLY